MGILLNQPTELNPLSNINFRFVLRRSPNMDFFVQKANIPSLNLAIGKQATPFQNVKWPGNKIEYGDLNLTFLVNQDMSNYLEIYNWLTAIGLQDNFDGYKALAANGPTSPFRIKSDATLTVFNGVKAPGFNVTYSQIFPFYLGELQFDGTETKPKFLTVDAKFKYTDFQFEIVNT